MEEEDKESEEEEDYYESSKDLFKDRPSTTGTTDSNLLFRDSFSKMKSDHIMKEQLYFELCRM